MDFCKKCENMYYMKKNDEKKLIHYCKHCDYEDNKLIETKNMKVFEYCAKDNQNNISINEYTRFDPTLPHMKTIKCPNLECPANNNKEIEQDVIYIRVDDQNMKYMYLCFHCNSSWNP